MFFVMECGPTFHGPREVWLVFSMELATREVSVRVAPDRDVARAEMAKHVAGAEVVCGESLADFGGPHGWHVHPIPEELRSLACVLLVGLEHEWSLGPLARAPMLEALLRASAMFLDVAPWRQFSSHHPLEVRLRGKLEGTRILTVAGQGLLPPSLLVLPDRAQFERAQTPGGELRDALVVTLDQPPTTIAREVKLAYGASFHPILMRLRDGRLGRFSEADLEVLTASLAAVTSLAAGQAVGNASGRATVGDVEALVTSLCVAAQPSP
jgi:hypothetical protein